VTNFLDVPNKKFFSISEVSSICGLKAHTLRFWETEFGQIKPLTGKGERRLYRKQDILLLLKIKKLLHEEKLTIKGAKKRLLQKLNQDNFSSNKKIIKDLEEILQEIKELI